MKKIMWTRFLFALVLAVGSLILLSERKADAVISCPGIHCEQIEFLRPCTPDCPYLRYGYCNDCVDAGTGAVRTVRTWGCSDSRTANALCGTTPRGTCEGCNTSGGPF